MVAPTTTKPRRAPETGLRLGALLDMAGQHGVGVVFTWLGVRGRLTCAGWWGSPRWPYLVDAFLARLDDSTDPFWTGPLGYPTERPEEVANPDLLRRMLLTAPDALASETVEWQIEDAGIGFIHLDS